MRKMDVNGTIDHSQHLSLTLKKYIVWFWPTHPTYSMYNDLRSVDEVSWVSLCQIFMSFTF